MKVEGEGVLRREKYDDRGSENTLDIAGRRMRIIELWDYDYGIMYVTGK